MSKKKLSFKQQLFCEYYLGECRGNAEQAAIKAGYSEKSARTGANKLLQRAQIQQYIAQKSSEIATNNIASIQEIQAFWTSIFTNEDETTRDRLKASELLAKAKGMFNTEWS